MSIRGSAVYQLQTANILDVVTEVDTQLAPVRNRLMAELVMHKVFEILDSERYDRFERETMLIHAAQQLWKHDLKEQQKYTPLYDPLSCQIGFYHTPDGENFAQVSIGESGTAYFNALHEISTLQAYPVAAAEDSSLAEQEHFAVWERARAHTTTVGEQSALTYALPHTDDPFMCSGLDRQRFYEHAVRSQTAPRDRVFQKVQAIVLGKSWTKVLYMIRMTLPSSYRQKLQVIVEEMTEPLYDSIEVYGTLPAPVTVQDLTNCVHSVAPTDFEIAAEKVDAIVQQCVQEMRRRYFS